MKGSSRWRALVGCALLALLTAHASPPCTAAIPLASGRDSVALRIAYKWMGSEDPFLFCAGPDWGWDTLTFRLPAHSQLPYSLGMSDRGFRVGSIVASDSAWFLFRHGTVDLAPMFADSGVAGWDSVLLTATPTVHFGTVGIMDASGSFQASLVSPWPERVTTHARAAFLEGVVRDSLSGEPLAACEVFVDRTKLAVETDARGRFRLGPLVRGSYGLIVCRPDREPARFFADAPGRNIQVRLAKSRRR